MLVSLGRRATPPAAAATERDYAIPKGGNNPPKVIIMCINSYETWFHDRLTINPLSIRT
jgi:hypothetical protein